MLRSSQRLSVFGQGAINYAGKEGSQIDWDPLRQEFKIWRKKNLQLPVWWRDDDATDHSAALDRLIDLSESLSLPVHLAIVPRGATKALADRLKLAPTVRPLVHGWAHRNNAPAGSLRCEFSDHRSISANRDDAAEAYRRLKALLNGNLLPGFVPPWNHIDPTALSILPELGFKFLSTCDARPDALAATGLMQINTHLDPIAWRNNEQLHDPEYLMNKLITGLKRRRQGKDDNTEPFGLLTHHQAMNEEVWEFTRQFWTEILDGPVEIADLGGN